VVHDCSLAVVRQAAAVVAFGKEGVEPLEHAFADTALLADPNRRANASDPAKQTGPRGGS
jgi:hypothetical protein